jgi:hypothetical protein
VSEKAQRVDPLLWIIPPMSGCIRRGRAEKKIIAIVIVQNFLDEESSDRVRHLDK